MVFKSLFGLLISPCKKLRLNSLAIRAVLSEKSMLLDETFLRGCFILFSRMSSKQNSTFTNFLHCDMNNPYQLLNPLALCLYSVDGKFCCFWHYLASEAVLGYIIHGIIQ
jgi:hypothetical protein